MPNSEQIGPQTLSELLRTRLVKEDLIVLWMDLFDTSLEDDQPRCSLAEGIVALLDRAKRQQKLPFLRERLWELRPDLRNDLAIVFNNSTDLAPTRTNNHLYYKFFLATLLILTVSLAVIAFRGRPSFTQFNPSFPDIYHLRVLVVDEKDKLIEDAKVRLSISNEAKKLDGAWQFDIPNASKPQDGQLKIFASQDNEYLKGEANYKLDKDPNPTIKVRIIKDLSSKVSGIVVDENNRAIPGATVSLVGSQEKTLTNETGQFILPAHAADGEFIRLHIEKSGYEAINRDHMAGSKYPALITLKSHF
jgi:Carboxypeptidase regulatory-like domain